MTCSRYRPDANGECLDCDEPAEAHVVVRTATDAEQRAALDAVLLKRAASVGLGMCGRCYDEDVPCYVANCESPEPFGAAGMFHCRDCGAMVLGGLPHPPICARCYTRSHPAFDRPEAPP